MTSKTSSVRSLLKFTLKKQTPQTLLIAAISLIICPGMLIAAVNDAAEYRSDAYDMNNYFSKFSTIIFVLAVLSLIFLLVSNFSFLFSKKAGDMYHALPLTRNELLFARTAASFVGAGFVMTLPFAALWLSNCFFSVQVSAALFLETYMLMLLFLLTLTVFTLIFIVISGGIFDCLIALFAVNAGLPALGAVFVHFYNSASYGIEASINPVAYLSPFGFTLSRIAQFSDGILYKDLSLGTTLLSWLGLFGYTLGVLAVSAVISMRLFHIRKSETAGESYSFKFVPAVISTVISMAGGYLIGIIASSTYTFSELDFWIFFILGSLLSSIVFGVIANRGFKKLYTSFIRGGVAIVLTVVAVITVALVSYYNVQYVPKAENVKEISAFDGNCTYTEREDIETFIELHKKVIENYKEGVFVKYYEVSDVIYNTEGFNFEYVMTNGKKVERDYGIHDIFAKNSSHLVLKLLCSDAFYQRYNDCIIPDNGLIALTMDGKNESIPISAEAAKNIIDTFKSEMRLADTDIFTEECFYINIRGKGDRHIYIPKSFTETVKLVESLFSEKG